MVGLNVRPRLTSDDSPDARLSDAVRQREFVLAFSISVSRANLQNLCIGQFRATAPHASGNPIRMPSSPVGIAANKCIFAPVSPQRGNRCGIDTPLLGHVSAIVACSSSPEMIRANARGDVAAVEDVKSFGNAAIFQNVGKAMRQIALPHEPRTSVAGAVVRRGPQPTGVGFSNFAPEGFERTALVVSSAPRGTLLWHRLTPSVGVAPPVAGNNAGALSRQFYQMGGAL